MSTAALSQPIGKSAGAYLYAGSIKSVTDIYSAGQVEAAHQCTSAREDSHFNFNANTKNTTKNTTNTNSFNIDIENDLVELDYSSTSEHGNKNCLYDEFSEDESRLKKYTLLQKIGEGTYGQVFKAVFDNRFVAIKKIALDQQGGVSTTALREVCLLRELDHPNIIALLDIIYTPNKLYLVFEYMQYDLKRYQELLVSRMERPLVKHYAMQLLRGVAYCHKRLILHRDLKPQNLLLDNKGNLRIADFGMARAFEYPARTLTQEVVTLWYRAFELLVNEGPYTSAVDIWATATIIFEMICGRPLFAGDSELHMLYKQFIVLGCPKESDWKGISKLLELSVSFPVFEGVPFSQLTPELSSDPALVDLLEKMLVYDPACRISATAALQHPWFDDVREFVVIPDHH